MNNLLIAKNPILSEKELGELERFDVFTYQVLFKKALCKYCGKLYVPRMYDLDKHLACSKHTDSEAKFTGTFNVVTKLVLFYSSNVCFIKCHSLDKCKFNVIYVV